MKKPDKNNFYVDGGPNCGPTISEGAYISALEKYIVFLQAVPSPEAILAGAYKEYPLNTPIQEYKREGFLKGVDWAINLNQE